MTFSTKSLATRTLSIRRPLLALALVLPVAAGGFMPAFAQDDRGDDRPTRMEERAERGERGFRPPMAHERDRGRHDGRHWSRHGRPPISHFVAMKLAAAEQAVGIKSAQLDAWRTFSAALVDFTTFGPPPRGGDGAVVPADGAADEETGEGIVDDGTGADDAVDDRTATASAGEERRGGRHHRMRERSAFDFLDRVITMSERQAEKAGRLKTALADLEAVLEPEQRAKLDKLLLPPRHMMRHMRHWR